MPTMTVEVVWGWEHKAPTAAQAKECVSDDHLRSMLRAYEVGSMCYLEFQTDGPIAAALRPAVEIQRVINEKFQVSSAIWVNHTTSMVEIIERLELGMLEAIRDLKKSQSFFGDRRIEAIKNRLADCFEAAAGCGYRRCRSLEKADA